ncbi:class I SAM-dependent methyltransferase [Pseudoalteromonas piscicida]|uniref:class I SAM-dependent methyltransferase n=1 Tax=Pseudoalteromonas piscicida TaxID=43662 RepID=UPI00309E67A7
MDRVLMVSRALVLDIFARGKAPDGLAHPKRSLIKRVSGTIAKQDFYVSGKRDVESLKKFLKQNAINYDDFKTVMDFGCGVARMARHFKTNSNSVIGVDYAEDMVDWCNNNLHEVGQFICNQHGDFSHIPDNSVDFIHSRSVFTHMHEGDFLTWLEQLARVVNAEGYVYLTINGEQRVNEEIPVILTKQEKKSFHNGELVVVNPNVSSDNRAINEHQCYGYVNREGFTALSRPWFEVVAFQPGKKAYQQDIYLLKKV